MRPTIEEIEEKLAEILVDDEAGWEAAAAYIASRAYEEGVEVPTSYRSAREFSSAFMTQVGYQNLQRRFSGRDHLIGQVVAIELAYMLLPSGFIFEVEVD